MQEVIKPDIIHKPQLPETTDLPDKIFEDDELPSDDGCHICGVDARHVCTRCRKRCCTQNHHTKFLCLGSGIASLLSGHNMMTECHHGCRDGMTYCVVCYSKL